MIAYDFFCGAGGLTRGLIDADINVKVGIDLDELCRDTYVYNNPTAQFLHADIATLPVQGFLDRVGRDEPNDLLLAACAPCQPFAQLNRSLIRDKAARLLTQFGRFVEALQPRFVFLENVPGLAKVPGNSSYRRFCSMLRRLGYLFIEGVLDAKDYGVPQTRRRLVLIAAQGVQPTLPPATHGPDLLPYVTVEDAIRRYPHIAAGETHSEVPNHRAARLTQVNLTRLQHTPLDGGDRRQWPEHLWLTCHQNMKGYTDVYGRMRWLAPAPTLTCRCHSISNGRYGHPEQHRAISLREAAKLQSFEDDYIFYGKTLYHLAAQIGNAVPVQLAAAVGRHLQTLAEE